VEKDGKSISASCVKFCKSLLFVASSLAKNEREKKRGKEVARASEQASKREVTVRERI
jgi:hypothetical protein